MSKAHSGSASPYAQGPAGLRASSRLLTVAGSMRWRSPEAFPLPGLEQSTREPEQRR